MEIRSTGTEPDRGQQVGVDDNLESGVGLPPNMDGRIGPRRTSEAWRAQAVRTPKSETRLSSGWNNGIMKGACDRVKFCKTRGSSSGRVALPSRDVAIQDIRKWEKRHERRRGDRTERTTLLLGNCQVGFTLWAGRGQTDSGCEIRCADGRKTP